MYNRTDSLALAVESVNSASIVRTGADGVVRYQVFNLVDLK